MFRMSMYKGVVVENMPIKCIVYEILVKSAKIIASSEVLVIKDTW